MSFQVLTFYRSRYLLERSKKCDLKWYQAGGDEMLEKLFQSFNFDSSAFAHLSGKELILLAQHQYLRSVVMTQLEEWTGGAKCRELDKWRMKFLKKPFLLTLKVIFSAKLFFHKINHYELVREPLLPSRANELA